VGEEEGGGENEQKEWREMRNEKKETRAKQ
jgi:hypothetical protein